MGWLTSPAPILYHSATITVGDEGGHMGPFVMSGTMTNMSPSSGQSSGNEPFTVEAMLHSVKNLASDPGSATLCPWDLRQVT